MKRPPDKRTNDTLASFFDANTVESETDASDSQQNEGTSEFEELAEPAEGELVDGLEDADATEAEPGPADGEPAAQPAADTEVPAKDVAGVVVMLLGVVLVVGSSVLIAMEKTLPGFSPQSLLLLGAVVFATSVTHRRIVAMQRRHAAAENQRNVDNEAMLQMLLSLQSHGRMDHEGELPLDGDHLKHLSLALQRQDEKINNLTKALKMYGKPLMEITGQSAELAGSLAHVKTAVDAGEEAARQTQARIEQLQRTLETQKPANSSELHAALTKAAAKLANLDDKSDRGLEPLQKQMGRLEASVGAALQKFEQKFEQKLENGDSSKRLQRIEEATKKAREDVQELLRGGSVEKATSQLQDRLDKATSRLSDGLQKIRDGNLHELESQIREVQREISGLTKSVAQIQASEGQKTRDVDLTGLETQVRDVQHELSGLARSVAQIQASVKNGAPRAEAPAPAHVASAAVPAREPVPAHNFANSAAPAAANGAAAEYSTGKRSTASKNVLGAIAKLKQMKG